MNLVGKVDTVLKHNMTKIFLFLLRPFMQNILKRNRNTCLHSAMAFLGWECEVMID